MEDSRHRQGPGRRCSRAGFCSPATHATLPHPSLAHQGAGTWQTPPAPNPSQRSGATHTGIDAGRTSERRRLACSWSTSHVCPPLW
ncbi:hypothetical protein CFC21_097858 [Triticum aestivum]|uniref:Uncharacterized protein n=3 Tax=Triticum TaxID=4564 RepID=A0A9R0ZED4_TRITD|nr:hypothetical protein CFC21_097858 [Triticum aestivum]VAI75076.1 unnamed protein product [Triticum turgidum subsp. durum]